MNAVPASGGATALQYLENIAAFNQSLACEVANLVDTLDEEGRPAIAAAFQLPYVISLSSRWIELPAKDLGRKLHFRTEPAEVGFSSNGDLELIYESDQPNISQFVCIIPYWGKRLRYYRKYSTCVTGEGVVQKLIVPSEESWLPNSRPMMTSDFEYNVCRRVYGDIYFAVRRFLLETQRLHQTNLRLPADLLSFWFMPSPGRVTFHRRCKPTLGYVANKTARIKVSVEVDDVSKRLSYPPIELLPFEKELFALKDMFKSGETYAALASLISLIEFRINNTLFPQEARQLSLSRILKSSESRGIVEEHRDFLLNVVRLRNAVVHGAPIERTSSHVAAELQQHEPPPTFHYTGMAPEDFIERLSRAAMDIFRKTQKVTASPT